MRLIFMIAADVLRVLDWEIEINERLHSYNGGLIL